MSYTKKFNAAASRRDIYQEVTNRIISYLEEGVRPWAKPWDTAHVEGRIMRPLRHNGEPYSGINVLMLWTSAEEQGLSSPTWMTYKQAKDLGGYVRKGEKGSPVVYASTFKKEEETEDGEQGIKEIPFLKTYTVFNVEQIDELPDHYYDQPSEPLEPVERIERAEAFFRETGVTVLHRGTKALYSVTQDHIRMPPIETFRDRESYYATLAHETTHWTRHSARLDRDFGRKKYGDEGYAREELVAELGAAYLCADLDLVSAVREDHAAYIASWLKVLKDDKRAIFQAASYAQKAADYLHDLQPATPEPRPSEEPDPDAALDREPEPKPEPKAKSKPEPEEPSPEASAEESPKPQPLAGTQLGLFR